MDPKLHTPFTMMIAGGSGCGKSTLVSHIIAQPGAVMDRPPSRIIVCYTRMQDLYKEMREHSPCPISFIEGLPQDLETERNSLLIVDDLQGKASASAINDWFTKKSHHCDTSVIYLVQNVFSKEPQHRTTSLNAHYILVFKNPRDASQVTHLAKQMFPHNPQLMVDAYRQATQHPHSYLVLDCRQETDDLYRLRSSLILGSTMGVFVDSKTVGVPYTLY